jgi:hypothetical protein
MPRGVIEITGPCEEASILSRETFIPCGMPSVGLVWHSKDRRAYRMCRGCTFHNVSNRGGILLAAAAEGELERLLKATA